MPMSGKITRLVILLAISASALLTTCTPTQISPQGGKMPSKPIAEERPPGVPSAAWAYPIGLAPQKFSHKSEHVSYPMIDDGPFQGLPLGGFGAGSIGRTYRGDFARWHLDVGRHRYEPIPACQFSAFMDDGEHKIAQVLWTEAPRGVLSAWRWRYPVGAGTYYALFPRAWFDYRWEEFPVHLTMRHFSPVIPHNYRETSYPVGVFVWRAENPVSRPVKVGVMFTWQNLIGRGWDRDFIGGHYNYARSEELDTGRMVGVVLTRGGEPVTEEWDGSFAIAALEVPGVEVSFRTRFRANGDGAEVWDDFAADGALENVDDRMPSRMGEVIA
ncbi:MAG TPA: bile acid beta-glucosidase, partial [Chloroflexi bacterium]|nr:bile acid beta-glucosidase [Chloroflexota bacterium]